MTDEDYYTVAEVAARLKVSTRHVRRIIGRGEIAVVATGISARGDRIRKSEFARYLRAREITREPACRSGKPPTVNIASASSVKVDGLAERLTRLSKRAS